MIESLIKEMGFRIELAVNYDPHHVISNRRKSLKRNPFEHEDIVGSTDVANWLDYPKETHKDTDMQEDSNSFVREITSLNPDTSKLISTAENITPFSNHSKMTNKRYFSDAMDNEEEDTTRTPKKQKTEVEGQLVQVIDEDKGKNKMEVTVPDFELKEYAFADTAADSTS